MNGKAEMEAKERLKELLEMNDTDSSKTLHLVHGEETETCRSMEKVDETITAICNKIIRELEKDKNDCLFDNDTAMIKALSELLHARAVLKATVY